MKCQNKRHYLSRAAAEAAATRTNQAKTTGKDWLYPYQCDQCRLWHLTSWSPQKQAYALQSRAQRATQTTLAAAAEPPSTKALRTKLAQISAALKLAERREDAARLKRALAMGKMVEADAAMRQAEEDYRAAQEAVLRLLGLSQ